MQFQWDDIVNGHLVRHGWSMSDSVQMYFDLTSGLLSCWKFSFLKSINIGIISHNISTKHMKLEHSGPAIFCIHISLKYFDETS